MKPPYTCNGCKGVRSCTLKKKVYDAKEAQKEYEAVRSESRQGINLTAEELRRVDADPAGTVYPPHLHK